VKTSNLCVRTLIFGSFLLLSFVKFFSLPLFCFFDLAFYCFLSFFIWFFITLCFPLIFRSCFIPVFFSHVVSSLAYLNLLRNKLLVIVVVVSITRASAATYISLQHAPHNHINNSHVSLLSPSQQTHSKFNHFRIYCTDNEIGKIN
jgi:hypothetical protein